MSDDKRPPRAHAQYGPTAQTVAANVLRLRSARSLSTYGLSRLLEGVGRTIAPSSITKIEQCRRQVTVDELMALAVVLQVNPSSLLLPPTDDPAESVEITGVGTVDAERAWDWMDGEMPIESIRPGDPEGVTLRFQLYARPPRRRRGVVHSHIRSKLGDAAREGRPSMAEGEPDGPSVD